MNVKQMIATLEQMDPEIEVVIQNGIEFYPIEGIVEKQAYFGDKSIYSKVEWPKDWKKVQVVKLVKSKVNYFNK